jgi:hypothetical protein
LLPVAPAAKSEVMLIIDGAVQGLAAFDLIDATLVLTSALTGGEQVIVLGRAFDPAPHLTAQAAMEQSIAAAELASDSAEVSSEIAENIYDLAYAPARFDAEFYTDDPADPVPGVHADGFGHFPGHGAVPDTRAVRGIRAAEVPCP